jgi:hypothetical protein
MAFQTGTSSSIENLLTQLSTFAVANGWTEDFFTAEGANPGRMGLSKNGIFVAFVYDEDVDGGVIGIGMNTSNDDAADPWLSTGDDGQLYSNPDAFPGSINTRRCVDRIEGPHVAYYFFEQDANPAYLHVVVEVSTNRFRHFGMGELEKIGDWVGGEYGYGHFWLQGTQSDLPDNSQHCFMMDSGASNSLNRHAGMRASGLPALTGAEEWLRVGAPGPFPAGQDRAGEDRGAAFGGARGGPVGQAFSYLEFSQLSAFKPLLPIPIWFSNTSLNPDTVILLGTHPDVRLINNANIEPGEIITVAGEDWFIFPWTIKKYVPNDNLEQSWNAGVAYRRETA